MLEFDQHRAWEPLLTTAFGNLISESVVERLVAAAPKYEDARDLLMSCTDREQIIHAALAWIRSTTVAGHHGSRLTDSDSEVDSIRAHGLRPLDARTRRSRLLRALSPHPRWGQVAHRLDAALHAHGTGASAGSREGQVHLTGCRGRSHYDLSVGSALRPGNREAPALAVALAGVGELAH